MARCSSRVSQTNDLGALGDFWVDAKYLSSLQNYLNPAHPGESPGQA
jgi:hypothetical protein